MQDVAPQGEIQMQGSLHLANEGEGAYQQAVGLCSTHFPQSRTYADCLYGLGILCEKRGRKVQQLRSMKPHERCIWLRRMYMTVIPLAAPYFALIKLYKQSYTSLNYHRYTTRSVPLLFFYPDGRIMQKRLIQ